MAQRSIPGQHYNETLLDQRQYHDWFWSTLSPQAQIWIKRPQCPNCHSTPFGQGPCPCTKQYKPSEWVNRDGLAWQLQAACKGADIGVFVPEEASSTFYHNPRAPWREYCLACPVTSECMIYAVDSHSVGVYAGFLFGEGKIFRSKNPLGSGKRGRPRKVQHDT